MRSRRIALALGSVALIAPLCACLAPSDDDFGACSGTLDGEEVSLDLRPDRSEYDIDELTDDPLLTLHYSDGDGHEVDVTDVRLEGPVTSLPRAERVPLSPVLRGDPSEWLLSWTENALVPGFGWLELEARSETLISGTFSYGFANEDELECTFSLTRRVARRSSGGGGGSSWDADWD